MLHKKKVNRGFTLVELLAVIVILAIILVIAVPKIMDVINSSKKSTLETSVKMIASAAEKTKMQNTVLGKEDATIKCEEVAKLSSSDYDLTTCTITFSGSTAKVTVKGKGKFDGLYVCGGTKTQATAQTSECVDTLVTHIQELYQTSASDNGLIKDDFNNIRYAGSNDSVKNYVEFGNTNEAWRIIGVFTVNTDNGSENLVKLVKEESVGNLPWDYSDLSINGGGGVNQWGETDNYEGSKLMQHLNGVENLNQVSYEFGKIIYPNKIAAAAPSYETFPESSFSLNSNYAKMIEKVWWNTGAINWDNAYDSEDNLKRELFYGMERGVLTGKICDTSQDLCNDTVVRTTSWKGKVALPYTSDYVYASTNVNCKLNTDSYDDDNSRYYYANDNWMYNEESTWMLSPVADSDGASGVSIVYGGGLVSYCDAYSSLAARPAIYLKSNVQIDGGTGAQNDPYILKME